MTKKKIAIILFNKQFHKTFYFIIIPRLALEKSDLSSKFNHGIKYILTKNINLILKTTNILYLNLQLKFELQQYLNKYKNYFFGFKFKNLYFSTLTISKFNYIQYFSLQKFLYKFKTLFEFLPYFIFSLKKKIIHNLSLVVKTNNYF